jgi:RNA-directed DNA polymerase
LTDLERLKAATSLTDLALILGFTPSGLSHTLFIAPEATRYRTFEIPKSGRGVRVIEAPIGAQRLAQQNLAALLQSCRAQIEADTKPKPRRPLSHGFRPGQSIITNARLHTGRRYVLNVDLQDFFPAFNFGRVRGFFIKDKSFALHPATATVIAQIACWKNGLPQGAPSSPIISDLVAYILDARLVRLAKTHHLTYSRYADDLTFSTNQKGFPDEVAMISDAPGGWSPGRDLVQAIESRGFRINPDKTRMQIRGSRQMVTGLTVNRKVNVNQAYYRDVRAMCHSLFNVGTYYRRGSDEIEPVRTRNLATIEGRLAHVHHVKRSADFDSTTGNLKSEGAPGVRHLYARFLFYKWFVALDMPLIICEGSSDNGYLRLAMRYGPAVPALLGAPTPDGFKTNVRFFNYGNKTHRMSEVRGGSENLGKFIKSYHATLKRYAHRPMEHPVILVIDNDSGASNVFGPAKKHVASPITHLSNDPFYHLGENLYLVKTPEQGAKGISCIEDLFEQALRGTVHDGKTFNPSNKVDYDTEYDKQTFLEKIVSPGAGGHDWTAFMPLLERIAGAIAHYRSIRAVAATSSGVAPVVAAGSTSRP